MKMILAALLFISSLSHAEGGLFIAPTFADLVTGAFSGLNDTTVDTLFTYSPTNPVRVDEVVLDLTNLVTTVTTTITVKRTFSGSTALGQSVLGQGLTLAGALAGNLTWTLATDADIVRIPLGYIMVSGDSIRVSAQNSLAELSAKSVPYAVKGMK